MFHEIKKRVEKHMWGIFILLLLIPLGIRYMNGAPITPLDDSYALIAGFPEQFLLIYALIPVLMGCVSLWLLGEILQSRVSKKQTVYAQFLFIISPIILTTFSSFTLTSLVLLIVLGSVVCYERHHTLYALILLALLVSIDVLIAGIVFICLGGYIALQKKKAFVALPLVGILLLVRASPPNEFIEPLFAEFGSAFGLSLFIFFLAIVAVILSWRTTNALFILLWASLLIVSIWVIPLRALLLIPLVIKAAQALALLEQKAWSLAILKRFSYLLLCCLVIFVLITHMQLIVQAEPQPTLLTAAQVMDEDPRSGRVLATTAYDDSLRYFMQRDVIGLPPTDAFFQANRLDEVSNTLTEQNMRFILITPEMRAGDVWTREDQGLLLTLQNNQKFIPINQPAPYEVWLILNEFVQ